VTTEVDGASTDLAEFEVEIGGDAAGAVGNGTGFAV
jgi:hypothetical protein